MKRILKSAGALTCAIALSACRQDEPVPATNRTPSTIGVYVLNQGGSGSSDASLDYWNIDSARYERGIYTAQDASTNGTIGDVGNDMAIYGSRLYIVVNGSNKVEVLNASTAQRIGVVQIPNCRRIAFDGGYAYVTSYAGASYGNVQNGALYKVDTAQLSVVGQPLTLRPNPDGIAITGGKAYVATNSGYAYPDYDSVVQVVNLSTFREERNVVVGLNPSIAAVDRNGTLWFTTSGDYGATAPNIAYYVPNTNAERATPLGVPASGISIAGDSLWYYAQEYDASGNTITSYGIINVSTKQRVSSGFITDGTSGDVANPTGIFADGTTRTIYIGNGASDWVSPGDVFIYGYDGVRQREKQMAGVGPCAFALRRAVQ